LSKKNSGSEPKEKRLSNNYDIAYDFSTKVYQKFREIIKSIILFGSVSKNQDVKGSDIDIIIVVDDASVAWDQELIAWYREELGKLIAAQDYTKEIHINTVTLTAFWEEVKTGTPVIMNVIRYGQPLIDFGGFFEPLKVLLAKGRIRPSPEAIFTTLKRAPEHIERAKYNILSSLENIYWAMVDSAHSALMAANQIPPSPEHVPEMLESTFVKNGALERKYVDYYNQVYNLTKEIMHGNINEIKTEEVDSYLTKATEFEQVMRTIASRLIEDERIIMIERRPDSLIQSKLVNQPSNNIFANKSQSIKETNIEFPAFNQSQEIYKDQSEELIKKNRELMKQVLDYKSQLEDSSKEKKLNAKDLKDQRIIELRNLQKKVTQLENQNNNLLSEIPQYKKQIDDLKEKNKSLIEDITSEKKDSKSDLKFPEFNPELDKLKQSNKELSIKMAEYKTQLIALQQKLKQPINPVDTTQLSKLQDQNKLFVNEISLLKKQIDDLNVKNKELLKKPSKEEIEFPTYNPELDNLKKSNQELGTQLGSYKSQVQQTEKRNKELFDQITSLKEAIKEAKTPRIDPEIEKLKMQNKDFMESQQKTKKQISDLLKHNKDLEQEYESKIKKQKSQIEELQKRHRETPSESPLYKKQVKQLHDKISELQKENISLDKEIPTYKHEVLKLEKEIKEVESKNKSLLLEKKNIKPLIKTIIKKEKPQIEKPKKESIKVAPKKIIIKKPKSIKPKKSKVIKQKPKKIQKIKPKNVSKTVVKKQPDKIVTKPLPQEKTIPSKPLDFPDFKG
jgi:kinetochore protein SLK19